jgi:hypothetical protein
VQSPGLHRLPEYLLVVEYHLFKLRSHAFPHLMLGVQFEAGVTVV